MIIAIGIGVILAFLIGSGIMAWLRADGLNDEPWDFGHKESET